MVIRMVQPLVALNCSCPLTGDLTSSACVCGCVLNGVSAIRQQHEYIVITPGLSGKTRIRYWHNPRDCTTANWTSRIDRSGRSRPVGTFVRSAMPPLPLPVPGSSAPSAVPPRRRRAPREGPGEKGKGRRRWDYRQRYVRLWSVSFNDCVVAVALSLVPSPSHPSFCLAAVEKKRFFSTAAR